MSDPSEQAMNENLVSTTENVENDSNVCESTDKVTSESLFGDIKQNDLETLKNSDKTEEDEWLDFMGSGDFKMRVIKEGKGFSTRPKRGDYVKINYSCFIEDKEVEKLDDFQLCVGDLDYIQAMDLAIPFMELEQVVEVLVPSRLAFGKIGRLPEIPPNTDLKYVIEVLEVQDEAETQLNSTEIITLGNRKRDWGNFWYGRSEYLNAIHCYQSAAKILDEFHGGPENSPEMLQNVLDTRIKVYNNMAAAQLKMESYDQALKSLDFVLGIQGKNVKAHFRKAKIYIAKGQTDEALASMRKAAELEPDTKVIQLELNRLLQKKKAEERSQRAMYKRMFPQSTSKRSYKNWIKSWSVLAGICVPVALAMAAAYRQYYV